MRSILSTAYWPNLHYFYYLLNSETVFIEQFEHYQKQSFRNRTQILSANGVLDLSVPVKKKAVKELTKDIEISYAENWQLKHWRAITSAYKNSPYFEHFESELAIFYTDKHENLLTFNFQQIQTLLKILKLKKEVLLTSDYQKQPENFSDLREIIHPKSDHRLDPVTRIVLEKPYYQTFETKFDFAPNLSILDLLFNKGLESADYLSGN